MTTTTCVRITPPPPRPAGAVRPIGRRVPTQGVYDPWVHADSMGIPVLVARLPGSLAGVTDGSTVWLDHRSFQWEATRTLAHELVHVELGHDSRQSEDMEQQVDMLAYSRLFPADVTATALRGTRCVRQINARLVASTGAGAGGWGRLANHVGYTAWDDPAACGIDAEGLCPHGVGLGTVCDSWEWARVAVALDERTAR